MPDPTREQFDAAVKAIIAGHKEGDAPLSREAFNQQITNEIARANPPERPSTSGFLRNLGDSTINLVTAPVRMVGSALTTDPGKTITNIGAGLRKRAGEYKRDPLGLVYRDPAGVGADLFAGGSILKALPGVYEVGMSGLRKAGGGAEAGESAYTGPKSSVLTGADQFRPNIAYQPTEGGSRVGGAPHFPDFSEPKPTRPPAPAPAEEHFFNSTDPANSDPNWHSGADPGSAEAASAQSVHKELGTMDSDWKRRMMDDKGSINPDLLTGVVLDELLRKLNVPGAIRKVGGAVVGPLVEGGLDLAAGSNDSTGGR